MKALIQLYITHPLSLFCLFLTVSYSFIEIFFFTIVGFSIFGDDDSLSLFGFELFSLSVPNILIFGSFLIFLKVLVIRTEFLALKKISISIQNRLFELATDRSCNFIGHGSFLRDIVTNSTVVGSGLRNFGGIVGESVILLSVVGIIISEFGNLMLVVLLGLFAAIFGLVHLNGRFIGIASRMRNRAVEERLNSLTFVSNCRLEDCEINTDFEPERVDAEPRRAYFRHFGRFFMHSQIVRPVLEVGLLTVLGVTLFDFDVESGTPGYFLAFARSVPVISRIASYHAALTSIAAVYHDIEQSIVRAVSEANGRWMPDCVYSLNKSGTATRTMSLDQCAMEIDSDNYGGIKCLSGVSGVGKTSSLRYLAANLQANQRSVRHVPQSLPEGSISIKELCLLFGDNQTQVAESIDIIFADSVLGIAVRDGSRLVNSLSGGEYRRLWLAMAFSSDAEFILMDEPTENLGYKYRMSLIRWLSHLKFERNVLLITHDRELLNCVDDNYRVETASSL